MQLCNGGISDKRTSDSAASAPDSPAKPTAPIRPRRLNSLRRPLDQVVDSATLMQIDAAIRSAERPCSIFRRLALAQRFGLTPRQLYHYIDKRRTALGCTSGLPGHNGRVPDLRPRDADVACRSGLRPRPTALPSESKIENRQSAITQPSHSEIATPNSPIAVAAQLASVSQFIAALSPQFDATDCDRFQRARLLVTALITRLLTAQSDQLPIASIIQLARLILRQPPRVASSSGFHSAAPHSATTTPAPAIRKWSSPEEAFNSPEFERDIAPQIRHIYGLDVPDAPSRTMPAAARSADLPPNSPPVASHESDFQRTLRAAARRIYGIDLAPSPKPQPEIAPPTPPDHASAAQPPATGTPSQSAIPDHQSEIRPTGDGSGWESNPPAAARATAQRL